MEEDLDIKLLGEKFPGTKEQRERLNHWLNKFLYVYKESWIKKRKQLLLDLAKEKIENGY